jgi:hypothetical protein
MTEQERSQRGQPTTYEIRVRGQIGKRWQHWFDGMATVLDSGRDGSPITTLTGMVIDQAELRGILNKLWDLNLTLVSVTRVQEDSAGGRMLDVPGRT